MGADAPRRHSGGMTTYATNINPFAAPARHRTGPLAATVTGAVAAFFAVVLIAGGAALLWVSSHKADDAGYYTSATHQYSTPTRALTTASLDVGADAPGWVFSTGTLGHVRIDPRAADSAKPVFVGIARTDDVDGYLDQVQHDNVTDVDLNPFTLDKKRSAGEGRPAMPAAQTFWAASSSDGRPLEWTVRSGDWSVVMMNADGSPVGYVEATFAFASPFIGDFVWCAVIPGLALAAV